MDDFEAAARAIERNRAVITAVYDELDTWNGAFRKKCENRLPIIRGSIAEPEGDKRRLGNCALRQTQFAGCAVVKLAKRVVEPADAAETRCLGDFGHRKPRFLDQLLGKQNTPRLRHRDWRYAKMFVEQAAQLPLTEPEVPGKDRNVGLAAIERTFRDQRQRARDRV